MSALEAAKAELARRESARPCVLSKDERNRLLALGADLITVWHAETTTPRDRKELLRALIEEVIVKVERDKAAARLTLRWKGGALDEIDLALPRSRPATIGSSVDPIVQILDLAVEVCFVVLPYHAVYAGSRVSLEGEERQPERFDCDVVEEPRVPSFQCAKRSALSRDNRSISWPVLVLWPMKRLNFRISQARSV